MKTKNLAKYFMVAAAVSIIVISCKKKDTTPATVDSDTSAASDNALAEGTFNDANNIADQANAGTLTSYLTTNTGSLDKGLLSSCATISLDTTSAPPARIITVNFGTTNCLCSDLRYRRGIIKISFSGHYRDSASVHSITFNNYFVNDNQILGTHTVTNNGHNNAGHLNYTVSVVGGQIIKANNGGTITWASTRNREWIYGANTPQWNDDVYSITGSASGTGANGSSYTATITTPIKIELSCHYIVSGVLDLTPSGKPTRTIDWGNGACDDQATVTINGHVYNITL